MDSIVVGDVKIRGVQAEISGQSAEYFCQLRRLSSQHVFMCQQLNIL